MVGQSLDCTYVNADYDGVDKPSDTSSSSLCESYYSTAATNSTFGA